MEQNLTLAIATIGDLLTKNRISKTKATGKKLENVDLLIPEYQRPYKWTAKNANQLFDDILSAKSEKREVYRVGTLILNRDADGCNIVDGQQRTITFSLLLKALGYDGNIDFLQQKLSDDENTLHNIPNNYRTFERRLKGFSAGERKSLLEYVENNCEMIVVITDDISEAFQFFDSQNARGKKLYPHDLLKAYHLREMGGVDESETEKTVRTWEDLNQAELSCLFCDYLYRVKEWIKGNRSAELNEHNIDIFKGITSADNSPYAQYYKGAYAYAADVNNSAVPFVTGMNRLTPFQINTPVIAGKPFFDYAKHYFDILADIRKNDKYAGCYISDNPIVRTLNNRSYRNGVGNRIVRLMFDTAILLYVDRFCPEKPSPADKELLEDHFVLYAFVWAYSLRAQYTNVGWAAAQNFIMGECRKDEVRNAFNIYKIIVEADSPAGLLSTLADSLLPLKKIADKQKDTSYLKIFQDNGFGGGRDET